MATLVLAMRGEFYPSNPHCNQAFLFNKKEDFEQFPIFEGTYGDIKPSKSFDECKTFQRMAVLLRSPGGFGSVAEVVRSKIRWAMQHRKTPAVFVDENASSAASLVVAAAPNRHCTKQTKILFHGPELERYAYDWERILMEDDDTFQRRTNTAASTLYATLLRAFSRKSTSTKPSKRNLQAKFGYAPFDPANPRREFVATMEDIVQWNVFHGIHTDRQALQTAFVQWAHIEHSALPRDIGIFFENNEGALWDKYRK